MIYRIVGHDQLFGSWDATVKALIVLCMLYYNNISFWSFDKLYITDTGFRGSGNYKKYFRASNAYPPPPPKKNFQGNSFIFNLEINALYYIKNHLLRNLLIYIKCIHVHLLNEIYVYRCIIRFSRRCIWKFTKACYFIWKLEPNTIHKVTIFPFTTLI